MPKKTNTTSVTVTPEDLQNGTAEEKIRAGIERIVKPEAHLDEPAGQPVEQPAAPDPVAAAMPLPDDDQSWPESTEFRNLVVAFDDEDKARLMESVAKLTIEKAGLKAEAKEEAKRFKGEIDALESRITKIADAVQAGGEEQRVECRWLYGYSGVDSQGQKIPHPEYKSLFRMDTGKFVTASKITPEERQMRLDLPAEEAEDEDEVEDDDFQCCKDGTCGVRDDGTEYSAPEEEEDEEA